MRFYPLFFDLKGKEVVFSGAGSAAEAKIRLLMKTPAKITVFGESPSDAVLRWASEGKLSLQERALDWDDVIGASLVYGANGDLEKDRRAVELGRWAGALTNIVDNLEESEFLTPAIVDRDPVTVAIGTEGTAPVLARSIKSDIEQLLPSAVGVLARVANKFRERVSHLSSKDRRALWSQFFGREGQRAYTTGGEALARKRLEGLVSDVLGAELAQGRNGFVSLVGAGPGDPELLTLKARKRLHDADVVLHDNLVSREILELARREAKIINVGKKGFGKAWEQADINNEMIKHADKERCVVRLKGGDPVLFGRLSEEIEALQAAEIDYEIVPGVTSASAAAASAGASLTKRGRNTSIEFITGHDAKGFADHDWARLAKPDAAAAIYMGGKAASFIAGRLLMHGASHSTPVTLVINASRPNQRVVTTSLDMVGDFAKSLSDQGPLMILLGIAGGNGLENALKASTSQSDIEASIKIGVA